MTIDLPVALRRQITPESTRDRVEGPRGPVRASPPRAPLATLKELSQTEGRPRRDARTGPVQAPTKKTTITAMSNNTKTRIFEMMSEMGHEQVVFCHDAPSGFRGIIAIHSNKLGPAVGGTRFWNYASEEEAMIDALRLSRGMTYKCAAAGVPLGGGKAIIIGDNKTRDREKLFRAHGRFVERLAGRYITAEDVGTSPADMELIALETSYVGGLAGKGGDPSPWTGLGAFRAMQAAARYRWGSDDLRGRRVAIQGCGNVGYNLAKELHAAGARLIVSDVDAAKIKRAIDEF